MPCALGTGFFINHKLKNRYIFQQHRIYIIPSVILPMKINNLELEWLGHSSFFISNGKKIYIDPFKINNPKKADIVLITHSHYDHCSIEDLSKIVKDGTQVVMPADCQSKILKMDKKVNIIILEPGQSIMLGDIDVKAVPAYNTDKKFHDKQDYWNGYVIRIEGKKIYHAGDSDLIPEMSELEGIDVALLPVSGVYTMNAEEAARAAILIRPKLSVPMHYGSIVGSNEDALKFIQVCEQEGLKCDLLKKS